MAGMVVLTLTQPCQPVRQAHIKTHLVQLRIGSQQPLQPFRAAPAIGLQDRLLKIESSVEQPPRDRLSVQAREVLRRRRQPGKEVDGLGEERRFLFLRHSRTPLTSARRSPHVLA